MIMTMIMIMMIMIPSDVNLFSKIKLPLPLLLSVTSVLILLNPRYGPTPKKPNANDDITNNNPGTFCLLLAPGNNRDAYTAGMIPNELNNATNTGLTVPLI